MSYCCCTPQIHCRYCQKAAKPFKDVKPFFKLSDKDFEKFKHKQRKPLTDEQLEKGRDQTFSINNPFCPCDSKTFRKVARWVEAAHGIKE